MRLTITNFQASALELAINKAVDSGEISDDVEHALLIIRDEIELIIDLQNLATENISK